MNWIKSKRCSACECIEAAVEDGVWHLRNTNDPDKVITADWDEIRAFVEGVIAGDFDVA